MILNSDAHKVNFGLVPRSTMASFSTRTLGNFRVQNTMFLFLIAEYNLRELARMLHKVSTFSDLFRCFCKVLHDMA